MLWMRKVKLRDAELVRVRTCEMLDEIRSYIKYITADNRREFSEHQYITDEYVIIILQTHIARGKEVLMRI